MASETVRKNTKKPVAPLKMISLCGCEPMAESVDRLIYETRKREASHSKSLEKIDGYLEDTYLLDAHFSRLGTGEGHVRLNSTVRGTDLYIIADITNYSPTYKVFGKLNHMSPDNHFQDLKRVISAVNGRAHRITVVMPFLYESRQHKRSSRESLDCASALKELAACGVTGVVTFDAHDPRVQSAIPLVSFDNFMPTYQFLKALLDAAPDLKFDNKHFMVISPDEGALNRAVYFANVLGADVGMFYKRRDYSTIVNGKNPIVAHEFLGDSVEGKDCVVIDDMISSGGSMLDVCRQMKERGARRVFICTTFGLFTDGFDKFDEFYEKGDFAKIITTNLTYLPPALLEKPYYQMADMYKYMASIIDALNHDASIETVNKTTSKMMRVLEKRKREK